MDRFHGEGIQTAGRLIQENDPRRVQEGPGKLKPGPHALRQALGRLFRRVTQANLLQSGLYGAMGDAVDIREYPQIIKAGEPLIYAEPVHHDPDLLFIPAGKGWDALTQDGGGALIRKLPGQYPDEGGFAGAGGAQQAEYLSGGNGKAYSRENRFAGKTFTDILTANHGASSRGRSDSMVGDIFTPRNARVRELPIPAPQLPQSAGRRDIL